MLEGVSACCKSLSASCVGPSCCQADGWIDDANYEVIPITSAAKKNPSMAELAAALKVDGGIDTPGADGNKTFLGMLDQHFPELKIYRSGRIQTSPGVEEIEGSPTEYYRTVGAMIALLAAYLSVQEDELGIKLVTAGERGPMSMDKAPGKFINLGNKPEEYAKFCSKFAEFMKGEEDWWAMMVFLAVHDVGKSDEFRNRVNATLEKEKRSDDHDRCLYRALLDPTLCEELLPTVKKLGPERQQRLADGFSTNFQLPQLGQGEVAVCNLRGLLNLDRTRIKDGTLYSYLYHSIFDIAGAGSNEKFIFPLAIQPVYIGFSTSMEQLCSKLLEGGKPDERHLYFDFLYVNFKRAYPEFEAQVFANLCESKIFRDETGIALLRVLALTRNTYKNPRAALSCLLTSYQSLVNEMAGNVQGPHVMLYYAPDMLRMGLGTDMDDADGSNIRQALGALEDLHRLSRAVLPATGEVYQFELNVQPIVSKIKAAGTAWEGGAQLRGVCNGATILHNDFRTEGIIQLWE